MGQSIFCHIFDKSIIILINNKVKIKRIGYSPSEKMFFVKGTIGCNNSSLSNFWMIKLLIAYVLKSKLLIII